MLQITGKIINVFTNQAGTSKDGTEFAERHKVQLMGERVLANGDKQMDLMDLTIQDVSDWDGLQGEEIAIEVGAFAPSKGNIIYFVSKGALPQLAGSSM